MTIDWPEGKAFAFTIVDDTDESTLETVESRLFATQTAFAPTATLAGAVADVRRHQRL